MMDRGCQETKTYHSDGEDATKRRILPRETPCPAQPLRAHEHFRPIKIGLFSLRCDPAQTSQALLFEGVLHINCFVIYLYEI